MGGEGTTYLDPPYHQQCGGIPPMLTNQLTKSVQVISTKTKTTIPMATISQTKKAVKTAKLFSIRKQGNVNAVERDILGSFRDYLNESISQSLSENVRDAEDTKCVTIRLDYEDTAETGEYGLLCFSKGLSKSIRNGRMTVGQMLDYPIQRQLIFQDLENKEPLIDEATGEQVVKFVIARPEGGTRIKVNIVEKKANLDAETW